MVQINTNIITNILNLTTLLNITTITTTISTHITCCSKQQLHKSTPYFTLHLKHFSCQRPSPITTINNQTPLLHPLLTTTPSTTNLPFPPKGKLPHKVCGSTTAHYTPTSTTTPCPTCTYTRVSAHIQCDMCGFNPTHTPTTFTNTQTSNISPSPYTLPSLSSHHTQSASPVYTFSYKPKNNFSSKNQENLAEYEYTSFRHFPVKFNIVRFKTMQNYVEHVLNNIEQVLNGVKWS